MKEWKRWLSVRIYGLVTSLLFRAHTPPRTMRARFARMAQSRRELQRKHRGLSFEDHRAGALDIEAVRALKAPQRTIVHLHGGAFVFGCPASYRNRAMRLSHRCAAEVFVPDYRLAPEHPFPAALDDAVRAIEYVRALRPDRPLFQTGDSAGGALALSALLCLRERGRELVQGAVLLSPWTDLSVSGASVDKLAGRDLWFTRAHLERWASYYRGATDARHPLLSPVFADLSRLPPLLVLVAEDELLLDDAQRVVERAQHAGTQAQLWVGAGMQHDFPLTMPWLHESRRAWAKMAEFMQSSAYTAELTSPHSARALQPAASLTR